MISIRFIKPDDLPFLLPLLGNLGYPTNLSALQERLELFLNQDGYGVAVATTSSHIVGMVAWSKSLLLVVPKTRLHIEALIVDGKYRHQGIGKKLMEFMEDIAQHYKPCIIDLTSGQHRQKDGTHDFYQRLGYQNQGLMAKVYLRKEINK